MIKKLGQGVKEAADKALDYAVYAFKWIFLAAITGIFGGVIGAAFYHTLHFVTHLRTENGFILLFLPIGGVLIALIYRIFKFDDAEGINLIINSVENGKRVPLILLPIIFVSTVITHLVGGSSGKEGAALQLGGSIGYNVGKAMRLDANDMKTITLCGMSGLFSALFGTPITAAVFAVEFISVGTIYYSGFFACVVSALSALLTARFFGCTYNLFKLSELTEIPSADAFAFVKVLGLSVVVALVSVLFILLTRFLSHYFKKYVKAAELRGAIGGMVVLLLTVLVGNQTYNGAGMETVEHIMRGGSVFFFAFALKMLFTAVSIASGFKGGEIVPSFFIGATLGYAVAPLLGLDPIFGAALGLVAFFCGVSNSTLASIVLSVELFGGGGIFYFALACITAFALSGNYGLYTSQKFIFSKTHGAFMPRRKQQAKDLKVEK